MVICVLVVVAVCLSMLRGLHVGAGFVGCWELLSMICVLIVLLFAIDVVYIVVDIIG